MQLEEQLLLVIPKVRSLKTEVFSLTLDRNNGINQEYLQNLGQTSFLAQNSGFCPRIMAINLHLLAGYKPLSMRVWGWFMTPLRSIFRWPEKEQIEAKMPQLAI